MSLWPGDGIVASQCYSWIWLNLDVFQVKRKRKKNEPWTVTQAQRPVDKNGVFQTVAIGCLQVSDSLVTRKKCLFHEQSASGCCTVYCWQSPVWNSYKEKYISLHPKCAYDYFGCQHTPANSHSFVEGSDLCVNSRKLLDMCLWNLKKCNAKKKLRMLTFKIKVVS